MTRRIRIRNPATGRILGEEIRVADRPWGRMRGYLGRPRPGPSEGMLFVPSRGIHTWGMRYPIDVLLLDREWKVVALHPRMEPWKDTGMRKEARYALELPEGTIEATGTELGDRLEWNL